MRHLIIAVILIILWAIPVFGQGSWTPFVTFIEGNRPWAAAMLNENYGFVETIKGWYRTDDGGINWKLINGLPLANFLKLQFYYYTASNIFLNGTYESKDSGRTWTTLKSPAKEVLYIHDGFFYDALGRISIDHAQSWKIIDTSFKYGETVVGNLDSGIAMWGENSFSLFDSTLFTTDNGKTWIPGSSGVESDFGYAVPHKLIYFRCGGDGEDQIQRTTDGGRSWQTVFGPIHIAYLSDGIAGDGCVVYAQTMRKKGNLADGVLRSIDMGNTWQHIGGPISTDDIPLCGVASRGAVCFAMKNAIPDTVWKYKDLSLIRPIFSDTKITPLYPNTIVMTECDSATIKIRLDFSACDFIRFHDLRIDGLTPQYYRSSFTRDGNIYTGHPDSGSITFLPISSGTYHFLVHVNITASDWSGSDTTFSITVIVTSVKAILNIDKKDTIQFGVSPLCNAGGIDSIELSNPTCIPVTISKIHFDADPNTLIDFWLSNSTNNILKDGLPSAKVFIHFNPLTSGIKEGKLIIETNIGNDTIIVNANILPDARILHCSSDTAYSPICDSSYMFLQLINLSCYAMSLDSLSVPYPFGLLPNQLPAIIQAGEYVLLKVYFAPLQRGLTSVTAKGTLKFFIPHNTTSFDTTLTLTGFAMHGTSSYALSSAATYFDTVRMCDSAKRHIVIYSMGCDSLPLSSVTISGDADFSLTENGMRNIATGDSIALDVSLNPLTVGNKSAVIIIILSDNSKVTVPVNATIIRAVRNLTCNVSGTMDFGSHLTCYSSDTTITLSNPNCDTIRISDIGLRGSGFGTNSSFPIILLPGESKTIIVQTILDTVEGVQTNPTTLDFISDADNTLSPVNLIKSYIYPHPVHLWLDADKTPLTSSNGWKLKLKGWASELQDVSQIDFSLNYNTDLLEYIPKLSTLQSTDGKTFQIMGSVKPDIDSAIAEIYFGVYLTKDISTSMILKNISLNGSDPNFMGCVAFPLGLGTEFNYLNVCGDPSVRRFIRGEPLQLSIRPNPAQDEIELNLESPLMQNINIEIRNALGAKVFSDMKNVSLGSNSIHLDTKDLTGGMYFVRVSSASGTASESFVKIR